MTAAVLSFPLSASPPPLPSVSARPACTRSAFHRAARRAYRTASPVTRAERRRVRRAVLCLSPRSRKIARRHLGRYKRWHAIRVRLGYWDTRWRAMSPGDKAWAVSTSSCESGRNPTTNTGNSFYGAFQFTATTAFAAGFRVLPHLTSLHEQDVRAIRWRNIAGRGQWPDCG